jgi:hypothetical protein
VSGVSNVVVCVAHAHAHACMHTGIQVPATVTAIPNSRSSSSSNAGVQYNPDSQYGGGDSQRRQYSSFSCTGTTLSGIPLIERGRVEYKISCFSCSGTTPPGTCTHNHTHSHTPQARRRQSMQQSLPHTRAQGRRHLQPMSTDQYQAACGPQHILEPILLWIEGGRYTYLRS